MKRRLVAVLAADAVGYSRLMAADEQATVAELDAARAIFRKQIESNQGRVIDTAGDSVLAVFELATGAMSAAIAVQEALTSAAKDVAEDQRMRFRIGVHLGEIIEKPDGTVYGDGVNIAARLQAKGLPGGISVSQTVYDTVKGRIPMRATFAGPETFKNISHPIPIWHVGLPMAGAERISVSAPEPQRSVLDTGRAPDLKSIAVLPFTNLSDDKDTGYFADGVHEDLLTHLALVGELKVVSRTSVVEYRDTKKKVRQIASELQVGWLVEGTVRRAGNHVRVTAQLIDAISDKHLWAKSYDRELRDIFAIQSELATEITKALNVTLNPKAEAQLATRSTENLEAYDLFLRAQELYHQAAGTIRIVSSIQDRIALYSKAVEVDPSFAHAWARLAEEHARACFTVIDRTPARVAQAKSALDKALALAPEDLVVRIAEAGFYHMALQDSERAAQAYEKVLSVAPHHVAALDGLALMFGSRGKDAERIALMERTLAVDPRNAKAIWRLGIDYLAHRHFDRALKYQQRLIDLRPDDLALQADYHRIEYLRTGAWASYDDWRSKLPSDAYLKQAGVHQMDLDRAAARRDWDRMLRLAEVIPEEGRGRANPLQMELLNSCRRACAHRAAGNPTGALESARAGLRFAETEVERSTRDWVSRYLMASLQAVLGEHDLALATHAEAINVARREGDAFEVDRARGYQLYVHALVGNRMEALAEIARRLLSPGWFVHDFRVDPELADLWDDSQFRAMVDDPKNNAPLPIQNRHL